MSRFMTEALVLAMSAAGAVTAAGQAGADAATHAAVASERALDGRLTVRRAIAVLPFTVTATDTSLLALGFGLAEFLSDDLAHSHRLMMVERSRLNELQREEQRTASGSVDSTTAVRVGRLVAARTLVIGAIDATDVEQVAIDERAVDVETAAVTMHRTQMSQIESIFRAERDLVMETFAAFGITLTPDEKRSLYERVAPPFRAFLSFSRGVRAENQGNDDLAAASYQEAASLDRGFKLAAAKLAAVRARVTPSAATAIDADIAKRASEEPAKAAAAVAAKARAGDGSPVAGSAPEGSLTSGADAAGATAAKPTGKTSTATVAASKNRLPKRFMPKSSKP